MGRDQVEAAESRSSHRLTEREGLVTEKSSRTQHDPAVGVGPSCARVASRAVQGRARRLCAAASWLGDATVSEPIGPVRSSVSRRDGLARLRKTISRGRTSSPAVMDTPPLADHRSGRCADAAEAPPAIEADWRLLNIRPVVDDRRARLSRRLVGRAVRLSVVVDVRGHRFTGRDRACAARRPRHRPVVSRTPAGNGGAEDPRLRQRGLR